MPYQLKKGQEAFAMVDGPFAGKSYRPGEVYPDDRVPPGEQKRFEKTRPAQSKKPRSGKTAPPAAETAADEQGGLES